MATKYLEEVTLSFPNHLAVLGDSLLIQVNEETVYDVRIHCSDGQIVRANRQLLCLGFHLFSEIFCSNCSCVTYLPVVYDVICSEFSSGVLQKVLESLITGQVGTNSFEESDIDEVQSILDTFRIEMPFHIEARHSSGQRQEEEPVDEILERFQKHAFRLGLPVSENENHLLEVSITIKEEDNLCCNDTLDFNEEIQSEMEWRDEDNEISTIGNKTNPVLCQLCGKKFGNKYHLQRHILNLHETEKHHQCHICQKTYGDKSGYMRHMSTVHENPQLCQICGKNFAQKSHLKRHIRTVHEYQRPNQCHICQKYFGQKYDLNRHILAVHESVKPHQCQICQKRFAEKSILEQHMRVVHGNVKAFQCHLCQAKFGWEKNLKRHLIICSRKSGFNLQ